MSTNVISRFQENFRQTPEESHISHLKLVKSNQNALAKLFQDKYQMMVIEKDPFTNRLRPTIEQLKHARDNAYTMIPEVQEEIDELKKTHKIRDFHERLIDGIKAAAKL